MARKKQQQRLDAGQVKQIAVGRWIDILADVGGIPRSVLDGQHHPCPQCGGDDRFRFIDSDLGAVFCNQCFHSGNGDGISAIQWALGVDFQEALAKVADYLGVAPASGKTKTNPPPDESLVFQEWSDGNNALVSLWCLKKPPITIEAIKAAGGRMARYRDQFTVIAIPVWGKDLADAKPTGWVVLNVVAQQGLPRKTPGGDVEWITKPKLTYGSEPGLVGDLDRLKAATVTWKVEGITDLLAMLSLPDLPPDVAVVTNSNGAQQKPAKWMADAIAGDKRPVNIIHDADVPGQKGALGWDDDRGRHRDGWAEAVARSAGETRNVTLPYPVAETHGQDLRDWLTDGHGMDDLRALAEKSNPVAVVAIRSNEKDDDPHRLARLNIERYLTETGRVIRFWNGIWWTWDGGKYRELEEGVFRSRLNARIKEEFDRLNILAQEAFTERKTAGQTADGEQPPFTAKVTKGLETNVFSATRGLPGVALSRSIKLNSWIPTKSQRPYIAMRNGILDVDSFMDGQPRSQYLLPLSHDWFSKSQLPHDFNPAARCPQWEAFLEQVQEGDHKRIRLLQEWTGYLLLPNLGKQKFVLLEGEGANGKSSYCAGVEAILGGGDNCSYVSLEQFADRFSKTLTLGKLVNISGDAPELDRMAEGVIKQFTGGTPMFFEDKGKPGFSATPTARLMVACNNRPRISDRSRGVWRRMIPIPWPVCIPEEDQIAGMDSKDWWINLGEVSGMFNWALAGLVRLRQQGQFTISEVVEANKADYELESNPTKQWLRESLKSAPPSVKLKSRTLFKLYRKWAVEMGYHPLAENTFTKELRREFGLTDADKLRTRTAAGRFHCFQRIDFREDAFSLEDMEEAYGHDF